MTVSLASLGSLVSFGDVEPAAALTVAGYLLVVTSIAVYGYRTTEDEADFLVAGREVGPIVGAGTLLASQISASTVVGAVGIHYVFGIGFIWVWLGILVGWLVALAYVAPQLRRFGGMTVPDFVGSRYADDGADGDYVRAVTALLIVAVFTVFLTAQYTAGALVFRRLLGLPETVGIVLTAAVAIVYTSVGGMRASVLTDFVQSVVLVGGLVVAVPLALAQVGGVGTLADRLRAIDPSLVGQAFPLPEIVGFMIASAVGVVAAPMEITRFYTMREEETVRTAIRISLVAQAAIALSVAALGLSARVLLPDLSTPDLAALVLSQELLGPVVGTLFIVAVLSAILSTIDSVMLVSSAGIAHDVYTRIVSPDASERRKLWVNRGAVLLVGLVPIGFALNRQLFGGLITLITLLNLSLQGATLFLPLVFGLHWERATTAGGVGAMLAGFGTVVAWHVGANVVGIIPSGIVTTVGDPVVPGLVASCLTLVGLSLLTDPPSERSTAPFFSDTE